MVGAILRAREFALRTAEQRAWLERDEELWRRAYAIVSASPRGAELDVGDVYHAIVNLERTPAERLARGLAHGRLRPRRA